MARKDFSELRNAYYRNSYRLVFYILNIFILITAVLAGGMIYTITHPLRRDYYATNDKSQLTELVRLAKPNLSTLALLQWASAATIAAYTYNFVDYRQALSSASEYFTSDGWRAFLSALRSSNVLKVILAKNLSVSAVITGTPVVLQQGDIGGVYTWNLEMPLLITYQSASELTQQRLIVNLVITRISTLESPRGIGIAQFQATTAGTIAAEGL
ncbi:MAG: type IVB secretion system apparatus protein IcmL/DotI [Pseudomonadota bacterium]